MLAFAQNSFVFSTCYFLSRESSGDIPCGPPVSHHRQYAPTSSQYPAERRAPALAPSHRPGGRADAFIRAAAGEGGAGHEQMLSSARSSLMGY